MSERLLNRGVRFYVVQHGDMLSVVCNRLGLNWRSVAKLNNMKNPDFIVPGQLIQLEA